MKVWGLLGALLCVGCSNSVESSGCPGSRPAFADCVSGPTWAECGGTGPSTLFACSETGGCYWFTGGCVPEGWVASSCSEEDVCCLDGSPFSSATRSSAAVGSITHQWGARAWDRTRERAVEISIAPLEAAEPSITCTGSLDGDRRCEIASRGLELVSGGGEVYWANVRTTSAAILFWQLVVEVTRDDDGSLHARVCHTQTTDVSGESCAPGAGASPDCAVSGTLVLDAIPSASRGAPDATTRMDLNVTFADGATLAMRL